MDRTKIILAVAGSGALSACAVSAPLSLDSTGSLPRSGKSVALTVADDDTSPNRVTFGSAIAKALTAHSVPLDAQGVLLADYGVSIGAASDGMIAGDGTAKDADGEPEWVNKPRKADRFDKCSAKRLRGTLVLIDRVTSAPVYRGSATRIECDFTPADIEQLAQALVTDAVK